MVEETNSVIPCINLATLRSAHGAEKLKLLQELKSNASEWGIFQVKGHGIDYDVLKQVNAWSYKFFNMPLEAKMKTCLGHSVGYMSYYGASVSKTSSLQLVVKPWNPVSTDVDELWLSTEDQKLFKRDIDEYCTSMANLSLEILQFLEEALLGSCGEKRAYFRNALKSNLDLKEGHPVRINYYAPRPEQDDDLRNGAHTDPNLITILHQDTPGLVLLKDDKGVLWEGESPETLIVNVGDCLEVLSNKVLPSALHNGVGSTKNGTHRISIGYFAGPSKTFRLVPAEELVDEEHPALQPTTYEDLIAAKHFGNGLV